MSQTPRLTEYDPESCCFPECDRPRRDEPADETEPPPLCTRHIVSVTAFGLRTAQQITREDIATHRPVDTREPVVYYVRLGDHIKIGTSVDLRGRLRAMYLDDSAVLATEPGSYKLEGERHREFAEERVHANRELFNPSPRLLAHIERLATQAA